MTCDEIRRHLNWSDSASKVAPLALESHLDACASCRNEFPEALPLLRDPILADWPHGALPNLELPVQRQGSSARAAAWHRGRWIAAGLVASVLLALAVKRPWTHPDSNGEIPDQSSPGTLLHESSAANSDPVSEPIVLIRSSISHSVITYHQNNRTVHSFGKHSHSHHLFSESQR